MAVSAAPVIIGLMPEHRWAPVWAWIRTYSGVDRRVEARAIAATADAVLIEGGRGKRRLRRGCGGPP